MTINEYMGFDINLTDWNEVMLVVDKIESMNYHGKYVFQMDYKMCKVYKGVKVTALSFGETRLDAVITTINRLLKDIDFNVAYRGGYITIDEIEILRKSEPVVAVIAFSNKDFVRLVEQDSGQRPNHTEDSTIGKTRYKRVYGPNPGWDFDRIIFDENEQHPAFKDVWIMLQPHMKDA